METFVSKLSLYDIISMVIPGGIILFVLKLYNPCLSLSDIYKFSDGNSVILVIFILFPLTYIIGIANHIFTSILWKAFRNNEKLISSCFQAVQKQFMRTSESNLKVGENTALYHFVKYCFIFSIAIVILCSIFGTLLSAFPLCYTIIVIMVIISTLCLVCMQFHGNNKRNNVLEKYYKAYYFVQQKSLNKDIPVMESQVAFLQAMSLPMALLATLDCEDTTDINCSTRILFFLVYISLFPMVYNRQKKIHTRVWEDYEFLKRI